MSRTTFLAFTGAALAIGTLASTSASAGFPQGHPASTARVGFSNVHQPQPAVNRFSNVHLPQAAINRVSNVQLPNHVSNVLAVPSQNNSSQNNTPGGAMSALNRVRLGGLSGLGVPGSVKPGSVGSDILNGSGIRTSITPSGAIGAAQSQIGGIQNQQGGAAGVQQPVGVSPGQALNLQIGVQKAKNSVGGAAAGVQQSVSVSPGQASILQIGAQRAKDSASGAAAGVQGKDPGVHLSDAQLKAIRNVQVNPVINQGAANDPNDGKDREPIKVIRDLFKPTDKDLKPSGFLEALGKLAAPKPPKPNSAGQ
jgi:hypothetical protein